MMVWPFRSTRSKKMDALKVATAAQKEAALRLQENLRRAHTERINKLFLEAMPKHTEGTTE